MNGNEHRGIVLQKRDRHLLQELGVLRVIDREQAKTVAGFHSTSRANVRLLRLTQAGLLRRFFLGTKGAGQKALYALSAKGAEIAGVPLRGPKRRNDESLAADYFIEHQLTVNRMYCALKYGPIPVSRVKFLRWLTFHEPLTRSIPLIPDGYAELQTAEGILVAFLEVDLGHERRGVWKAKVRHYLQLALSGECKRLFGQSRFRVFVLAPTERRASSIRKTVAEITEKIFRVTTIEAAERNGLFGPIWFRPKGATQEHLITPPT
jgi:hypothetical protein